MEETLTLKLYSPLTAELETSLQKNRGEAR